MSCAYGGTPGVVATVANTTSASTGTAAIRLVKLGGARRSCARHAAADSSKTGSAIRSLGSVTAMTPPPVIGTINARSHIEEAGSTLMATNTAPTAANDRTDTAGAMRGTPEARISNGTISAI